MKKIEPVVYKETGYICVWVLILSALMQAVFLVIGKWSYTVLLGNLLGGAAAVLNFLVMAIGVQRALEKEPDDAEKTMKLSQSLRFLALIVVVAIGAVLNCFNTISVIIPLLFPQVGVFLRPLLAKKRHAEKEDENEG